MSQVDEGLIHAWLEDQLPPDEAARVEELVATDAAWSAAAAEARGLIAASSRVLGALDSAPSAGVIVGALSQRTQRSGRASSSWARKYWLRAAAAIVLVGGISGVWFSGDKGALDVPAKQEKATPGAGGPPAAAESQSSAVQQTSPRGLPVRPQASAVDARRDASRLHERASGAQPPVASSPPPTAPPPPTPPATASARDEAAGARVVTSAKDSSGDGRAAGTVGELAAGRGGGRGARGAAAGAALEVAALTAQRSDAPRSDVMKSLASAVDSVQRGCWVPLETPSQSRVANESARLSSMVLRFVPPVVTDLAIVSAPALSRAIVPPPAAPASALRAAPANARMQHTTARAKDDSTLVAEWFNPDGRRTQLTFRVSRDTLRGTTNTITGDVVTSGPVLVAVRVQCPPQ